MNWERILFIVVFLLEKVLADDDKDGRPNIFDDYPGDKERK